MLDGLICHPETNGHSSQTSIAADLAKITLPEASSFKDGEFLYLFHC